MSRPITAVWYKAPAWGEKRDGKEGLRFDRTARTMPMPDGWSSLARGLLRFGKWTGDKQHSPPPLWSPIEMKPGEDWCKAVNVAWVYCLVMDYDDGTTIEDAHGRWEPWEHVLHTSWSHGPQTPKVRVVLPLIEPVPADEWRDVYTQVLRWDAERSGMSEADAAEAGLRADRACKDPSRMFYVPALGKHGHAAGHVSRWHGAQDSEDARPWLCLHDMRMAAKALDAAQAAEMARRRAESQARARDVVGSREDAGREVRRRLLEDAGARLRLGEQLGGRVVQRQSEEVVKGVECPGCGRPSLWWIVEPNALRRATCDHANSCGYRGHLWEVAAAAGMVLS